MHLLVNLVFVVCWILVPNWQMAQNIKNVSQTLLQRLFFKTFQVSVLWYGTKLIVTNSYSIFIAQYVTWFKCEHYYDILSCTVITQEPKHIQKDCLHHEIINHEPSNVEVDTCHMQHIVLKTHVPFWQEHPYLLMACVSVQRASLARNCDCWMSLHASFIWHSLGFYKTILFCFQDCLHQHLFY